MRVRDRVLVSFSGDEELFYRNGSSGQLKAYLVDNLRKRMFCVKSEFTISTFSLLCGSRYSIKVMNDFHESCLLNTTIPLTDPSSSFRTGRFQLKFRRLGIDNNVYSAPPH